MASSASNRPEDNLTLILVPGRTGQIRRWHLSWRWLHLLGGGLVVLTLALIAGTVDWVHTRTEIAELDALRRETREQQERLQAYAQQIQDISSALARVGDFERKLRVITNLDPAEPLPLPGIGGVEGDGLEAHELVGLTRAGRHRRMVQSLSQLQEASVGAEQSLVELVKHLEDQTARLLATPSIAPTRGWVTSGFGYRSSPFTGRRELHRGIDIAARQGTPILAPADGRVRYAAKDRMLGQMVIVKHGYGIETIFGHLSEALVKPGDKVKRGDRIALMGNSGRSTGPHLHYQVNVNGVAVNPRNYMLD